MTKQSSVRIMAVALVTALVAMIVLAVCRPAQGAVMGEGAWTYDGTGYLSVDGVTYIQGGVRKGLDISGYEDELDWAAAQAAGVDFAIFRCGEVHRNYSTFEDGTDLTFRYNVAECERLGIPYGMYFRSHATTVEEVQAEAELAANLIAGTHPTYPVYFDLEDADMASAENAELLAQITRTFCDYIEAQGFRVGVYGSLYWFANFFTDPVFDQWPKWVADWKNPDDDPDENPLCRYGGSYGMWQASSTWVPYEGAPAVDLDFQIDQSLMGSLPATRQVEEQPTPPDTTSQTGASFADVPSGAWFAEYVSYVASRGAMVGYGGDATGSFGPYDGITRGQVATILYRLSNPGSSATTDPASYGTGSPFVDVPAGRYYTEAIRWCREVGVVTGDTDASGNVTGFRPEDRVTREELATMIARYASMRGSDVRSADTSVIGRFPDGASVSSYARTSLAWCVSRSIITGNAATNPPLVKPQDTATRAEAAKMFCVLLRDVLGA